MLITEPEIPRGVNRGVFTVNRKDGSVERYEFTNARTNAGASAIAQLIGSGAGLPFLYVALTSNNTAPAATDTTLTGEYTTAGLSRVLATFGGYVAPASLGATATYVLSASWSCTINGSTVNKIAAFTAITVGIMGFETLLATTVTLNNGDTGALTWTFTV